MRDSDDLAVVLHGVVPGAELLDCAVMRDAFGNVADPLSVYELGAALRIALRRRDAERALREERALLESDIRAREEQLETSEARLRYVMTTSPVTKYSAIGADGYEFNFLTPNVITLLGYPPEFLIENKRFWSSIIHPDDRPGVLAARAGHDPDGTVKVLRYRCRHSDGTWRWIRDDFLTRTRPTDGLFEFIGALFDVTERQVAEQDLRQSEARLKEAERIAKLGHWHLDLLANFVTWSSGVYEIFERDPNEFAPTSDDYLKEIVLPEDEADVRRFFLTDIEVEKNYSIDHRFVRRDGTVGWVHLEARGAHDAAGQLFQIRGTVQDITDRKRVEIALNDLSATLESRVAERTASLAESETRFRALFEQAAVGVAEVDSPTGRPIRINRKFAEILGYEVDELLVGGFGAITHPDDRAEDVAYIRKLRSGELSEFSREKRLIRKDGSVIWVNAASAPLWAPGEAPSRHISVNTDITALKRSEETLREQEAVLSDAQRLARLGSWELDLVTNKLIWSDEIFRIFEIDKLRFEASYESFLAAVHPADRDSVNTAYAESVANRTAYRIEHRLLMNDGRIKWVEERGRTGYDDAGRPYRSWGTVQDITGRWQLQEATRAISTDLLTLEGTQYCEAVANKIAKLIGGDIVFITRFDRAQAGELETVVLIEDGQVMPNLRYNLAGKPCADVISGGPRIVATDVDRLYPENTFLAKRRIAAYAAVPLVENSGRIIGHLGFMSRRSIEDQELVLTVLNIFAVAVAAALVRERGRREYRDLFEFAPGGLVLSDQKGRIVLVNKHAEEIFGWTRSELVGQSIEILIPRDLRNAHVGLRENFVRSPKRRRMAVERAMLQAQRKDGSVIPVEVDLAPVETDNGVMIAAAVRDITVRKELEVQLAQATKMEAMGKLTGGMAHDFNNYLGVIIGNLDLLKETDNVTPSQIALIDAALSGAVRSADLTRSLLAFSRQQPLDPRTTDINARIDGVVGLLRRTLGEDIELKTTPGAGLWRARIDGALLDSCIVNLANNARDAMPNGGSLLIATRNVHLDEEYAHTHAGSSVGDFVLIEVSDTGQGMSPDVVARVFEPFFTTKQPGHGTGLGLSMVYGFVKQSGGYINIYSEPGLGTTVRIYLPRSNADAERAEEAPVLSDGSVVSAGETILLVEDNDDVRETSFALLSSLGYRVIQAANAETALIILEAGEPIIDLLFTDVVMPGPLGGFELAEVASQRRPGIKILMTSGFPGDALHDNESNLALALLSKPYRKADLERAIRAALEGRDREASV